MICLRRRLRTSADRTATDTARPMSKKLRIFATSHSVFVDGLARWLSKSHDCARIVHLNGLFEQRSFTTSSKRQRSTGEAQISLSRDRFRPISTQLNQMTLMRQDQCAQSFQS
ncbi:hypothetical protein AcV7_006166 [Taiwanofungus camphoratus]|nr:hypothetical protein AcV7_006166 [Antrodia cinnamomea]